MISLQLEMVSLLLETLQLLMETLQTELLILMDQNGAHILISIFTIIQNLSLKIPNFLVKHPKEQSLDLQLQSMHLMQTLTMYSEDVCLVQEPDSIKSDQYTMELQDWSDSNLMELQISLLNL